MGFLLFYLFFFWRLLGARGSIQSFTLSSYRFLGSFLRNSCWFDQLSWKLDPKSQGGEASMFDWSEIAYSGERWKKTYTNWQQPLY
jgi:hypothetical protein